MLVVVSSTNFCVCFNMASLSILGSINFNFESSFNYVYEVVSIKFHVIFYSPVDSNTAFLAVS